MLHYRYMIVYKYGQTPTANNFRGQNKVILWKIERNKLFPNRELNRYSVGSKAHTLPLSDPGLFGPERKRIFCIRNIETF